MAIRSTASTVALLAFVGLVLAMVAGSVVGQPVLLGFVETGSMSPTMEPGDGFVALPPWVAGDVQEGDVVTFEARELDGGRLTTHRIVGETAEGFVTKGDANPFTDQDGPEPPVQESQIVAVALEVNGDVVVIPYLGGVALALRGFVGGVGTVFSGVPGLQAVASGGVGATMVGIGLVILALSFVPELVTSGRDTARRSRTRPGVWRAPVVLAVILLLIVVPVTANMVVPSGNQDITIISSSSERSNPTVIQAGTSQEFTFNVTNNGYVPRLVVLEPVGPGIAVDRQVLPIEHGQTVETTVTVTAPDETGAYVRSLSERHYLLFLPVGVVVGLHRLHPLLAVAAIDLVVVAVVTAAFLVGVGGRPLRLRSRERELPLADRLRRAMRKWL